MRYYGKTIYHIITKYSIETLIYIEMLDGRNLFSFFQDAKFFKNGECEVKYVTMMSVFMTFREIALLLSKVEYFSVSLHN